MIRRQWGATALSLEQDFSRNILGNMSMNTGFPTGGGMFQKAMEIALNPNPGQLLLDTVAQENGTVSNALSIGGGAIEAVFASNGALGTAMEDVFGSALDTLGHVTGLARDVVPIIGGVVNAIVSVIQMIRNITNPPEEDSTFSYKLAKFSPTIDLTFANNNLIGVISGQNKDWTSVWSPPGLGSAPYQYMPPFSVTEVRDGNDQEWGVRISASDANDRVGNSRWSGLIPLSGEIDLGWELPVGGNPHDTRSLGSLLPTMKEQGAKLWSFVNRPHSPSALCVDTEALRSRWAGYLLRFRIFLQETDRLSDSTKQKLIDGPLRNYYGLNTQGQRQGWASWNPADDPNQKSEDLWRMWKIKECPLFDAIDALEQVQRATIDSTACAYITDDFVALKKNAALKDRWENNRIALLEHPQICNVDIDNIPDTAYRNVARFKADQRNCDQLTLVGVPFGHGTQAPPPASGLLGLKAVKMRQVGARSGGGAGMIFVAGAIGLLLMSQRKRR
jgi:hypothetical protein